MFYLLKDVNLQKFFKFIKEKFINNIKISSKKIFFLKLNITIKSIIKKTKLKLLKNESLIH